MCSLVKAYIHTQTQPYARTYSHVWSQSRVLHGDKLGKENHVGCQICATTGACEVCFRGIHGSRVRKQGKALFKSEKKVAERRVRLAMAIRAIRLADARTCALLLFRKRCKEARCTVLSRFQSSSMGGCWPVVYPWQNVKRDFLNFSHRLLVSEILIVMRR